MLWSRSRIGGASTNLLEDFLVRISPRFFDIDIVVVGSIRNSSGRKSLRGSGFLGGVMGTIGKMCHLPLKGW